LINTNESATIAKPKNFHELNTPLACYSLEHARQMISLDPYDTQTDRQYVHQLLLSNNDYNGTCMSLLGDGLSICVNHADAGVMRAV
jgi:hypothetical protein